MSFTGFGPAVKTWFEGLEADNSREYFRARREFYEESIRGQLEALFLELEEQFGGELKLFRQNRDTRFSADKSPYKTNTYGVLYGASAAPQGLYASISARGLLAGSGYHFMARDQLERYREAVVDPRCGGELAVFTAGAVDAGLEIRSQTLRTAPRGYPLDHERIELLRRKSLSLGALLRFGGGIGREAGLEFVFSTWRAAAPVTAWLERHVGASTVVQERQGRRR